MAITEMSGSEARDSFIGAMAGAATGVTVVTTDGAAGRFGQTVSAMSSVSADPPTVLVCVHRKSPLAEAAERNGYIAVNVLADDQVGIAQTFAGRPAAGAPYDFDAGSWDLDDVPVLTGAAAVFVCEVDTIVDSGTHAVIFGRVCAADANDRDPLLYSRRAFARPIPVSWARPERQGENDDQDR